MTEPCNGLKLEHMETYVPSKRWSEWRKRETNTLCWNMAASFVLVLVLIITSYQPHESIEKTIDNNLKVIFTQHNVGASSNPMDYISQKIEEGMS
jgi:hypothetical protein